MSEEIEYYYKDDGFFANYKKVTNYKELVTIVSQNPKFTGWQVIGGEWTCIMGDDHE